MAQTLLSTALTDYLAHRQARYAATTVTNETWVLERFVANVGDRYVRDLTAERVEAWFYGQSGIKAEHTTRDGVTRQPVTATTLNYYRSRLASFFRYLTARGLTTDDLLRLVPPAKAMRRERIRPGVAELLRMLDSADNPRDRALLATAMNTGMRSGELLSLRVGDVDLAKAEIRVFVSKSQIEDKLPMTTELLAELRTWLTTFANEVTTPLDDNAYLFPSRIAAPFVWTEIDGKRVAMKGTSIWRPGAPMHHPQRVVQKALLAIGVKDVRHEGVHTLRRSFARALFDFYSDRGFDHALRIVSSALHHTNVSTTQTYLGLTAERETRDRTLRGQSFLGAMAGDQSNVLKLAR